MTRSFKNVFSTRSLIPYKQEKLAALEILYHNRKVVDEKNICHDKIGANFNSLLMGGFFGIFSGFPSLDGISNHPIATGIFVISAFTIYSSFRQLKHLFREQEKCDAKILNDVENLKELNEKYNWGFDLNEIDKYHIDRVLKKMLNKSKIDLE